MTVFRSDPKIISAPSFYAQGFGLIEQLSDFLKDIGENPLLLVDPIAWQYLEGKVTARIKETFSNHTIIKFNGECTHQEIERVSNVCTKNQCDMVVGLGGGKTLDTAKACTLINKRHVCIVPTIASSDAPTSRLAIVYDESGVLLEVLRMPRNPTFVLVDTEIIANAPVRFFIAGIGDALPTKFEAEQSAKTGYPNMLNGRQTNTALFLADNCYQILREYGEMAVASVAQHRVTEAVELVTEATVLLSGIGFESGGLAAAHAMTRGLSTLPELKGSLHGEEVAFGLLVQFVLENRPLSFLQDIYHFYEKIGLPTTLKQLGLENVTKRHLITITERTCAEGSHIYKMAAAINERILRDALLTADRIGIDRMH